MRLAERVGICYLLVGQPDAAGSSTDASLERGVAQGDPHVRKREGQELRKFAVAGMLSELIPTVDNFQRAFQHLPEELKDHDWVKGIEAMEQDLLHKLSEAGLKKIEALGQPVDPQKHEVLQVGHGKKDIVTEVFEGGYECNGKILRPAKVKVGDGT